MPIKVTGIRTVKDAQVGENVILAYFDVYLEGIMELRGCAYVKGREKIEIWAPPCARKANEPERAIRFSPSLRRAVVRVVGDAYRAFEREQAANDVGLSAMVELVREIEARDAA
jgi:hypothetical protein